MEMIITITLTEKELHDLANLVQIELWKTELSHGQPSIVLAVGQKVIAAANQAERPQGLQP